jgi:hypothetical protein
MLSQMHIQARALRQARAVRQARALRQAHVLRIVTPLLEDEDFVNLQSTCKRLHHLLLIGSCVRILDYYNVPFHGGSLYWLVSRLIDYRFFAHAQRIIAYFPNEFNEIDKEMLLQTTAIQGNGGIMKALFDVGISRDDEDPVRLLCLAASQHNIEVMRYLLNRGQDINAVTKTGTTALYVATMAGSLWSMELLLLRGARRDIVPPGDQAGKLALSHSDEGSKEDALLRKLLLCTDVCRVLRAKRVFAITHHESDRREQRFCPIDVFTILGKQIEFPEEWCERFCLLGGRSV